MQPAREGRVREARRGLRLSLLLCLALLSACAGQPTVSKQESHAWRRPADTSLGRYWQADLAAHPGQSGFVLLADALDAFVVRIIMIERAEQTLDVQYYTIQDDSIGRLILQRLLSAADRGVRVRILVDDIYADRQSLTWQLLTAHPNMEVRRFNPWRQSTFVGRFFESVLRIGQLNHRMHNKLFVADNAVAVVGGRNLGDEYFDLNDQLDFRDLDVMSVGPIVPRTSQSFDEYWNSPWAEPVCPNDNAEEADKLRARLETQLKALQHSPYVKALQDSNVARALRNQEQSLLFGRAEVVVDRPEKVALSEKAARRQEKTLLAQLPEALRSPQQRFWASSPYFVPGSRGSESLRAMAARGVDVRVLTNSMNASDVPLVHASYAPYRRELLLGGVHLYELKREPAWLRRQTDTRRFGSAQASLHAKAFVVDGKTVFIGSPNLDPRSLIHNTEIALVIDSPPLAQQLEAWFQVITAPESAYSLRLNAQQQLRWSETQDGQGKTWDREPATSWWQRTMLSVMSVLPLEGQM